VTPAEFPGQTYVIAKDQPEYLPLPAHIAPDGRITCCWQLTWKERIELMVSGRLWHQILTFRTPLQPQILATRKPELCESLELTQD
jgi:hypothetical protein